MASSDYNVETMSAKDAHATLSSLRRGRGGRTSKYQPILEEVENARKGQIVVVEGVAKGSVQGLRAFIYRYLDNEKYQVKSAQEKDADTYTVAIGRVEDFD